MGEIALTENLSWDIEEQAFVDIEENEYCNLATAAALLYEKAAETYSWKNHYEVAELNDAYDRITAAKEKDDNERNVWCLINNGGLNHETV